MINGTGWTVVQRRVDGSVSFQRGWNNYRHGFGGAYGEHWVGTDRLHWLTTQRPYQLRVDLWDWDGGCRRLHLCDLELTDWFRDVG